MSNFVDGYSLLTLQERLQLLQNALRNAETQKLQAELNIAIIQRQLAARPTGRGGERQDLQVRLAHERKTVADLDLTIQVVLEASDHLQDTQEADNPLPAGSG